VDCDISQIGFLVWMGGGSTLNKRKGCATRAEILLRKNKDSTPRPVSWRDTQIVILKRVSQKTVTIIQIAFIDEKSSDMKQFPVVFGSIKNLIGLMETLNLLWGEILLKPLGETSSSLSRASSPTH